MRVPENKQFALFLTPHGRSPISGNASQWHPISYQALGSTYEHLLTQLTSEKVSALIHDWLAVIPAFQPFREV